MENKKEILNNLKNINTLPSPIIHHFFSWNLNSEHSVRVRTSCSLSSLISSLRMRERACKEAPHWDWPSIWETSPDFVLMKFPASGGFMYLSCATLVYSIDCTLTLYYSSVSYIFHIAHWIVSFSISLILKFAFAPSWDMTRKKNLPSHNRK